MEWIKTTLVLAFFAVKLIIFLKSMLTLFIRKRARPNNAREQIMIIAIVQGRIQYRILIALPITDTTFAW